MPTTYKPEFNALITLYIQHKGEKKVHTIKKPSKREVTIKECQDMIKKLKSQYGVNLKRYSIVDIDKNIVKQRFTCREWAL